MKYGARWGCYYMYFAIVIMAYLRQIFGLPDGQQNVLPVPVSVVFTPIDFTDPLSILWKQDHMISYNVTLLSRDSETATLKITSADDSILKTVNNNTVTLETNTTTIISVTINGVLIGRTFLEFYVHTGQHTNDNSSEWIKLTARTNVIVTREDSSLNSVFIGLVILLVCSANVAMGCKTDLHVVKETLKKPIAPGTGMFSQFVLMPLISFAVGIGLDLSAPLAFGFFAMGCSPGGAASNIYTYFLDGNVSLSVTMTLVSCVASMAMIPLWLFTLGINVIYKVPGVTIPFVNIVTSIIGLVIPVGIGIIIQKKKPNWARIILKALRPITVLFIILVFTLGVYANIYVFQLITPVVLVAGALVPYCGFLFGAVVALLTRRSKADILTIAIETGIQNTGVAIVLLQLSLPSPDSDISIVAPIIGATFTPIPMVVAMAIYVIKKRFCINAHEQLEVQEFDNKEFHSNDDTEKTYNETSQVKIR